MSAPLIKVGEARLGIDNAFARMPFRFGVVTIEAAASLTLELDISVDGKPAKGYAADLLSYKWFDKRPEKTPADNVADLLGIVEEAVRIARGLPQATLFELWRELDRLVDRHAVEIGFNRLGASFGVSMVERAMLDGLGRALGLGFRGLLDTGATGLHAGQVFAELGETSIAEALPAQPLAALDVRHTIGLVDPLTAADVAEPVGDGLPETLEDYLVHDGIRYLKVKVGGDHDADLARLEAIAALLDRHGTDVAITLDGNEQYRRLDDFAGLMDAVRSRPALARFYEAMLFVEQPLERSVALAGTLDPAALDQIGRPLLIDEADGWTGAFREAIQLGYRGVSHKNCKGVIRSVLNAMLAARHNATAGRPRHYFQSAEDLTCLPAVSLQADLAVVATLGISHVERNGHHYFRGLDHLPEDEAEAALAAHPQLYERAGNGVRLALREGRLAVGSLHAAGLGASTIPDLSKRIAPKDWSFAMLQKKSAA